MESQRNYAKYKFSFLTYRVENIYNILKLQLKNTCEQHDVAWVMGCKRDNAVLESIGQIEEDEYREYRNNKDVQTDARVAIAPHAMNQRKYGFYVVNKKVKSRKKKTSFYHEFSENHTTKYPI